MNIRIVKEVLTDKQIEQIEKKYSAKFVCESSVKGRFGWIGPAAIFYTEIPHPRGSNWFAVRWDMDNKAVISDAKSSVDTPIKGIVVSGQIIYSRHTHDFVCLGGVCIDGGREYTKIAGDIHAPQVTLRINKDKLEVVP